MLGSHGVDKCDANGEVLLSLRSEYNLVVTNTLFKHTHKASRKKNSNTTTKRKNREKESVVIFISKIQSMYLVFGAI